MRRGLQRKRDVKADDRDIVFSQKKEEVRNAARFLFLQERGFFGRLSAYRRLGIGGRGRREGEYVRGAEIV